MIRAVQEFFCAYGRCREVQLSDGSRHSVLVSIAQIPGGIEMRGRGATNASGLRITYRGHKESLVALGCISREALAAARWGRYEHDARGAILCVESKTAPGRRRFLEVSYFTQFRSFAGMLPGVRAYGAEWLQTLTARPKLRLVVDNTRRKPSAR